MAKISISLGPRLLLNRIDDFVDVDNEWCVVGYGGLQEGG